jgi:hypothetical protein
MKREDQNQPRPQSLLLAIWDKDTKAEGNRIFVTWVDCYLRLFECLCVRMGQTMTRVVR